MTHVLSAALAALCVMTAPQFKTGVEVITIDALVTSGGRPIVGLTAADFEVRDNGVLQKVEVAESGVSPVDVILTFDTSASLTPERLAQLEAASQALLMQLRPGDRAALVTFDQAVTRRHALTGDFRGIQNALPRGTRGGRTSLVDATLAGMGLAEGDDRRTLLLVFSDGLDTGSWLEPGTLLDVARRASIVIYGVATPAANSRADTLRQLADATGGQVLNGASAKLQTAFTDLLNEFRHRYVLTFSPATTAAAGWHRLETRVSRRGATVKARAAYFVPSRSSVQ